MWFNRQKELGRRAAGGRVATSCNQSKNFIEIFVHSGAVEPPRKFFSNLSDLFYIEPLFRISAIKVDGRTSTKTWLVQCVGIKWHEKQISHESCSDQ
jgi:hypothetical protein